MEQNSSSQYPRALIVEDDTLIALGLETQCVTRVRGYAISNQPNVVLMDVFSGICYLVVT